jgi:hypothetical protein
MSKTIRPPTGMRTRFPKASKRMEAAFEKKDWKTIAKIAVKMGIVLLSNNGGIIER